APRHARRDELRGSRACARHPDRHRHVASVARAREAAHDDARPAGHHQAEAGQMSEPVTEAELQAYADGRLPAERYKAVEAWLATRPEESERIAAYRRLAHEVR